MNTFLDFNKAKIFPDDIIIFEKLWQDLFKKGKDEDRKSLVYKNAKIDETWSRFKKYISFAIKAL